jgi:hypothetical protein
MVAHGIDPVAGQRESNILLNGVSGTSNATFNGILQTSGTLTRAIGTDSPLDCLSKAYVDLRVGAAFADPDLVLMHPSTLGALRRQKDADGRYVMDLLAGPLGLTAYGQPSTAGPANEQNSYSVIPQGSPAFSGNLWGAQIATSTQIAAGTAIVASVKAGAGANVKVLQTLLGHKTATLTLDRYGHLYPDDPDAEPCCQRRE